MPAPIIIFDGTQPLKWHSPPNSRSSTAATGTPAPASFVAANSPPGPMPMTSTSNSRSVTVNLQDAVGRHRGLGFEVGSWFSAAVAIAITGLGSHLPQHGPWAAAGGRKGPATRRIEVFLTRCLARTTGAGPALGSGQATTLLACMLAIWSAS